MLLSARRAALLGSFLVVAACGDDSAGGAGGGGGSTGSTTGSTGASTSTASATSASSTTTATGGGGGEGGAGGGGGGGGALDCDGLAEAMATWLEGHQTCSAERACERLDDVIPPDVGLCDPIGAPGDDLGELEALAAAWTELGCEGEGLCGFTPGAAVCGPRGTCTLEIDDDCARCDDTLDPVCTEDGQNAVNACWAAECLLAEAWEPGYCPDSAECNDAGGTCEESFYTDAPPCADGFAWDPGDVTAKGCPGGNLRNECCVPWGEACSFVASSNTLSLDPFTCAAPTGGGQPWTCLHMPEQLGCELDGTIEQPLAGVYDAEVVVTASEGSAVQVVGTHADGSSFTCDGVVSFAIDVPHTWSCEACDAEGACTTCEIEQTAICAL